MSGVSPRAAVEETEHHPGDATMASRPFRPCCRGVPRRDRERIDRDDVGTSALVAAARRRWIFGAAAAPDSAETTDDARRRRRVRLVVARG